MSDYRGQVLAVYWQLGCLDAREGRSLEAGREHAVARATAYEHQREMLDEITAEHERGFNS